MENPVDNLLFVCTHCGKKMVTRPDRAGKTVHCIRCHCAVRIPTGDRTGVPAPHPLPAAHASKSGTALGDPAAFDTQVVPAPADVSLPTLRSAASGAPRSARRTFVAWRPRKTVVRRVVLPLGAGAIAAAIVIAAMALFLHSTSPAQQARASDAPATQPASR